MTTQTSPSAEEFHALQESHQALVQTFTGTAGADIALFISLIGHVAENSPDSAATIRSIGTVASQMLAPVLQSEQYPQVFKDIMTSRIESIIDGAQRNFAK